MFNNVIGLCITINCLMVIRFENLKVITSIYGLLFLYDIFWVFYSEFIFQRNVMVTVAEQNFTRSATTGYYLSIVLFIVVKMLGQNTSSTYNLEFPVYLFIC